MSVYEDIKTGLEQAIAYEKNKSVEDIGQKGWICPVCGRGLAPWVDYCPCQGSEMKITYGTSTSTDNKELNTLFELNNKRVDEIISFQEKYGR